MKKILITQRLISNQSYYEIREALDTNYSKLLSKSGFLPIALPYEINFIDYFNEFNISGILLTGGNDLNSFSSNPLSEQRDIYEKNLITFAIEKNIPIFGICRGLQIIAEYFGSTFKKVLGQVNTRHTIKYNNNSSLSKELKNIDKVNSFHNFAIDDLGEELKVSATNESGMIKAIEHKKYKIFAQMWHSERKAIFSENEIKLIQNFFEDSA
tara:strand:- start:253 stop:888 length:636 start_codon:yes stop_codon:yes gene_type:complete